MCAYWENFWRGRASGTTVVWTLCVFVALIWECPAAAQIPQTTKAAKAFGNLQAQHREFHERFADALERVAQTCEQRDLEETAAQIRRIAQPADPDVLRFESLPQSVQPPVPDDLPPEEREWRTQLREHRKDYAKELDLLAQKAVKAGFPTYAYQLVRETALHDSDHVRARRLLGFVRYKDDWVSPFEAERYTANEVWTDEFGWLKATNVERYKRGERKSPADGWVSAARDADLRRDFRKAWQIRTEHYLLKTNESLERGVAMASSLEEFHRFFQQTFAAFFNDAAQIQKLFAGNAVTRKSKPKPFVVHFYSSRDEYLTTLFKKYQDKILITNGLYDVDDQIVYFFHNPNAPSETTLFHEATHQLLAAHLPPSPVIAKEANFWLIEGIACYVESYQRQAERLTLGHPKCERFVAARHTLIKENYFQPLSEFTRMGQDEYQKHKDPVIRNNYSQAAGLTHFFMHFEKGRYRGDLIEHLRQIYAAAETKQRPESLEALTEVSFEELDRQYIQFTRDLSNALHEEFPPAN